ncbi:hypothetical protein IHE31_13210 [Mycetohabitans rhizoxinica]|uniref:Uncharacterized protein n=2 Tax=Mycetohabitans rhizoxinica TaxID=412963 RepID=E5AKV3_MYCRK|nr:MULTISPECIES: hypothetical protein [Mycetohabitans]MCF7696475.1 hypothetical protein [Mycetohabitans sp. B2]MCG1047809.1 hypothetical protein [Mycetohabitans sp. B6]CBW75910.1 unnamed protein product [Mycetohabitans rhizoxinica HKI 454]
MAHRPGRRGIRDDSIRGWARLRERAVLDAARHAYYAQLFDLYKSLCLSLKEAMPRLRDIK